jgi:hypothetical protein
MLHGTCKVAIVPPSLRANSLRGKPSRKRSLLGIVPMLSKALLHPILDNDALTRGLGDMEARILVEWLVDEADRLSADTQDAEKAVQQLCRWARAVSRFVYLCCYAREHGAACQLAASERFEWPWPSTDVDPFELMEAILDYRERQA